LAIEGCLLLFHLLKGVYRFIQLSGGEHSEDSLFNDRISYIRSKA
jgi:hypothetical protein